jgi:hypothetical protein
MKEEFSRFSARDKEGRVFRIVVYQNYVTHQSVHGRPVVLKGDMEYWTDSGLPVEKLDSETYQIMQGREKITKFY